MVYENEDKMESCSPSSLAEQQCENLAILAMEKALNLILFVKSCTVMKGDLKKKYEEMGEKALFNVVQKEICLGIAILSVILQKEHGWTFEKLQKAADNEDEYMAVLNLCMHILNTKSGTGTKINESLEFNEEYQNSPELQKQFFFKLYRYLLFYANIHLVLIPDAFSKENE